MFEKTSHELSELVQTYIPYTGGQSWGEGGGGGGGSGGRSSVFEVYSNNFLCDALIPINMQVSYKYGDFHHHCTQILIFVNRLTLKYHGGKRTNKPTNRITLPSSTMVKSHYASSTV